MASGQFQAIALLSNGPQLLDGGVAVLEFVFVSFACTRSHKILLEIVLTKILFLR